MLRLTHLTPKRYQLYTRPPNCKTTCSWTYSVTSWVNIQWWHSGAVEEYLYPVTNSTLDKGDWSTPTPAEEFPSYRRLSGSKGRITRRWRRKHILLPPGFEPRTIQPVESRYTVSHIPDPVFIQNPRMRHVMVIRYPLNMDRLKETAGNRNILPFIQQFQITKKLIYITHILVKSNRAN